MISRLVISLAVAASVCAQPLRSLKGVPVPDTPGLDAYVRDRGTLIALGKAFFWDMQAGSDGRTACASCHFHAGADHRAQNQIADPNNPFPANLQLTMSQFPLRELADPGNRNSTVLRDTAMRVGSAGLFRRVFKDIVPGRATEIGEESVDHPEFMLSGLHVRRVTARNSPSVINAAYYVRGFWDGRAARVFNGATPSGNADDAPGALVLRDGQLVREPVRLDNASLASQATGPILDHLEMSYAGRTWTKLGKKMLSLPPLALQRVAPDDSVLGRMARLGARGLQYSYLELIQEAFQPGYWASTELVDGEYTQAEANFPLFWGLALQAYQASLISNDSPFDRFQDGDAGALTAQQQEGMRLFQNQGRCTTCHGGAEFSAAVFSNNGGRGNNRAFQRTGVREAAEDAGSGNGSFKSVGLRNVELTGPYFHNGGQATLEQVIDFYARGGDFANNAIRSFNMNSTQKAALAAFLRSLTDDRVRHERAPFDHPELCVPAGHPESRPGLLIAAQLPQFPRSSMENWRGLAPVGAAGHAAPLRTFEELLQGIGADGARANAMNEGCTAPLP
ncbi:MAG: cytochrome-c peroxidase [Bryobacteraceae bacterium]